MKAWDHWSTKFHGSRDSLLDRLRKRLLDFLNLPPVQRPLRIPEWALIQHAEPYTDWARKQESGADLGKEFLSNIDDFTDWAKRFAPSPENWPDEEGEPFYIPAPLMYPTIVVWTRIHRDGLVACEFYWDYVTLADFGETL
jgi:hypothetical protein